MGVHEDLARELLFQADIDAADAFSRAIVAHGDAIEDEAARRTEHGERYHDAQLNAKIITLDRHVDGIEALDLVCEIDEDIAERRKRLREERA